MAVLYPFIATDAQAGEKVALKLHGILCESVGYDDILILNTYEVDLIGHLSIIVYSGNLRIRLHLMDQDETAQVRPCILQINSHIDSDASYRVQDNILIVDADFDGRRAGIRLSRDRDGKMTRCELAGYLACPPICKSPNRYWNLE